MAVFAIHSRYADHCIRNMQYILPICMTHLFSMRDTAVVQWYSSCARAGVFPLRAMR